jgi:hypothetical protein
MQNDNPTTPEEIKDMEKDMNLGYRNIYNYLQEEFQELVEKEGLGEKFKNNNHSVSIHRLRHYVVTTVEELTNVTSAYFWVGKRQAGYIFNDKDPKAILDLYNKVELSLTFLNPKIVKQTELKELESTRQEMKEMRKDNILTLFQTEVFHATRESKQIVLDEFRKSGGQGYAKKFAWSPKLQIRFFVERMKKMGKTIYEDQIKYIKEYLMTSEPIMIYQKMTEEEEKEAQEWESETERERIMTEKEIEDEDRKSLELHAKLSKEKDNDDEDEDEEILKSILKEGKKK